VTELLAVGLVTRAHGVKSEVAVRPLTEVESRFQPGAVLLLGPDGDRVLTVGTVRGPHHGKLLIHFREVSGRDEAESLRGQPLLIDARESPPLSEPDRYWVHEIVGLEVRTDDGRPLGRVREVLHNAANDVWVVEGDGGDVLIPAVREVVTSVDVAGGHVVIRDTVGLLGEAEGA
jgi:16S rRNA processing protein RimM